MQSRLHRAAATASHGPLQVGNLPRELGRRRVPTSAPAGQHELRSGSPFFCRFSAVDRPGVLSRISGILGNNEISLKSVHQKGRKTNGSVPLVMLTHSAIEAGVQQALAEIAALDVVSTEPVLIRIEDDDPDDAVT